MKVNKINLSNGLTLLVTPMSSTEAVTVLILVRAGSRYEEKRTNGISHFLEHMMFKGTARRPKPIDVSRELDGVGAEFNAFTGKNHTGFYVKVGAHNLSLAVDILGDILMNSLFNQAEMDRERGVIVEEINMYDDNPIMMLDDVLEQHLFGSSSLGWMIAGERENITNLITRDDLTHYYRSHYIPKRMVVSIAGNCTEANVKKLITPFLRLKNVQGVKPFLPWNKQLPKDLVKIKYKDTQQVHFALGTSSYKNDDSRLPALKLMSVILGGSMSSRLFISVREQRGLAYMIRAGTNSYEDTGSFMVEAGLDKSRIETALQVILDELKLMEHSGVTKEELARAKEYISGKTTLGLEDSESQAQWYGSQWLLSKKLLTPQEKLAKIMKVTSNDVLKVARDILANHRLRLALIGPFKNTKPFENILKTK